MIIIFAFYYIKGIDIPNIYKFLANEGWPLFLLDFIATDISNVNFFALKLLRALLSVQELPLMYLYRFDADALRVLFHHSKNEGSVESEPSIYLLVYLV